MSIILKQLITINKIKPKNLIKCSTISMSTKSSSSSPEPEAPEAPEAPSTQSPPIPARKMNAWQIHSYGDLDEIQYSDKVKIPIIQGSNEVLVKIIASSINPIDIAMTRGYGSSVLNILRCNRPGDSIEFPLILGRDFTGHIVHKGMAVRNSIELGDHVWGVIPIQRNGCHAEYVTVDANYVSNKPFELNDIEASGVLYAGLTAWSGLFISGELGGLTGAMTSLGGGKGKRVCILGASGGVGNIATQICLAENCEIVVTCSTDAVSSLEALGVRHVIDYKQIELANEQLVSLGPYDIILDCAGRGANYANELKWNYKHYVTFNGPMLKNIDNYGLAGGSIRNLMELIETNLRSITIPKLNGRGGGGGGGGCGLVKWGYFIPASHGIEYLTKLVQRKKLLPVIEEVFDFKSADKAYERVAAGHLRGKIILNVGDSNKSVE